MEDLNIIERKYFAKLSQMSTSRGTARFFATFLILWGSGLLYLLEFDFSKLKVPQMSLLIYLFSFVLILVGILWFKNTFVFIDHFTRHYNERSVLKKMRLKSILGVLASAIFCSLFIAAGIYTDQKVFLIFGLIFFSLLVGVGTYGIIKAERTIVKLKHITTSELVYLSSHPFARGNTVKFELINASSVLQGKKVVASLRFLREKYLSSKKNAKSREKSKSHQTICDHEEQLVTQFTNGVLACQFTIPSLNVGPTHIDYSEPEYWELEFLLESEGYYSRFILDVI